MANRPSVFNNEFFDAGVPAAGYKLYTYESGTTTPKATYTDQAGSIPNANPITLDADGMCELWLGSGEYTLALYTGLIGSGGALVKTWDDVEGAASSGDFVAFRAEFAGAPGSSLVGFSPSTDYPVSTIGLHANADLVSVWDFMTAPQLADIRANTGLVDQYSAFLAAHAFALANKKSVYAPAGKYLLETQLDWSPSVGLIGEAKAWWGPSGPSYPYVAGTWFFKAHNGDFIHCVGAGANTVGSRFADFTIRSDKTAYPLGHGIYVDLITSHLIDRINVMMVGGDAFHIGNTAGDVTTHVYLTDCYANNPGGRAFYIRSKWSRLYYPRSDGGTIGLYLDSSPESVIQDSHFEGWTSKGVYATQSNHCALSGKTFIGNTAGGTKGVELVSNSDFFAFGKVHFTSAGAGDAITIGSVTGSEITDNVVDGWANGVLDGGTDTTIRDTAFSACGAPITVTGNRSNYHDNRTAGTTGSYSITMSADGAVVGNWTGNDVDKPIYSTVTTSQTDFGNIRVLGNIGHKTEASGITGSVVSGATVAHGLVAIPEGVLITPTSAGLSDVRVNFDATNITFLFTGPNGQFCWNAWNKCAKR